MKNDEELFIGSWTVIDDRLVEVTGIEYGDFGDGITRVVNVRVL